MDEPIGIAAHQISCQRGGRTVFSRLGFALAPGEALFVSGPNGAGKTSLLRLIAGLLPLAAGRFSVTGPDADTPLPEHCHYIGHASAVKNALSVRENLAFWAEYLGSDTATTDDALEAFGLGPIADLPAALLSAGQKRKLGLSRLFVASRPVWLLDEPSVSLDAASVKLLDRAITQHIKGGGIAVVASHTPLKVKFAHQLPLGAERAA
ncbi:MAG: heme ABC exporter ATP-binding protein CcmA [Methyloceanibacter sp.]|uniref:heme ABC exporter ATP-binding protein CcmA n=1 Tax=Methyloceanibacter sp. TaxID=1965321 RepID=UPI003D9B5A41